MQKQLQTKIHVAKVAYKNKIEAMFRANNCKNAWKGLKLLCGYTTKETELLIDETQENANEFNAFYARFDKHDHRQECEALLQNLDFNSHVALNISRNDVHRALRNIKISKSSGPDGVSGRLLKFCTDQLDEPLHGLFQSSLDRRYVPALWKHSEIIPVPKTKFPKVKNDYRPVALTSIIMKCFEHIIKNILCTHVFDLSDPLQFAYRKGRSVNDAALTLTHNIFDHLEKSNASVRVLFVDFSSAQFKSIYF